MKKHYLLSLSLLALSYSSTLLAQWTDLQVPTTAKHIAVQHDGNKLYANNSLGGPSLGKLYLKSGSGTWNEISNDLPSAGIYSLYCASSNSLFCTLLDYVKFKTRIMKSTDNGTTWVCVDSTLVVGATHTFVEGNSGDLFLFNYANQGTLLKSSDDGATWTSISTNKFRSLDLAGNTLYGTVFTSATDYKIVKSTDNGTTWTDCGKTGYPNFYDPFTVGGGPSGTIFSFDNGGSDSLYRSTDGGSSWTKIPKMGRFFADEGYRLFVNQDNMLHVSLDQGNTFTDVTSGSGVSGSTSVSSFISIKNQSTYLVTVGPNNVTSLLQYTGPTSVNDFTSPNKWATIFQKSDKNIVIEMPTATTATFELFDLSGKLIKQQVINNQRTTLEINETSSVFIYRIVSTDGQVKTGKLIF